MYKTRADLETENHRFRKALEMIKDEGRVCSNFELCHHEGCTSSYASWAIADAALTGVLLPVIAHERERPLSEMGGECDAKGVN